MIKNILENHTNRLRIIIFGAVQGVGFRPHIYKLATGMNLNGFVSNNVDGVIIEVEGPKNILNQFVLQIENNLPSNAFIQSLEHTFLNPVGYTKFEIKESKSSGTKSALILPDIATCPKCLNEIFDKSNRRYLYPFTNCTNCGPRYSIIKSIPYDRKNTSMNIFEMCNICEQEYKDPLNRRFHAQPNACPQCGPKLQLWNNSGDILLEKHAALLQACKLIVEGKIVAVKGIGGFHLIVDASNDFAVNLLRERKNREEKPFAMMFPSIDEIKKTCTINQMEERLLLSPESPIVILKRINNPTIKISNMVAFNNPYFGIMLPYTPLHHIIIRYINIPIIATSGNISDEPICFDEIEAVNRLKNIADFFLVNNRPIIRYIDDSIVRIILNREMIIRRARGYAPLPIYFTNQFDGNVMAVGAHLKNTIAISNGNNIFISQHIGDLETKQSADAFKNVIKDFPNLYDAKIDCVASDLHPDYYSSQYSAKINSKNIKIQHHCAHILSCMAENELSDNVLGIAFDGTGYGYDNNIWGGEFFLLQNKSITRFATFKQFKLPGGNIAIKEPRRSLLGMLYEIYGDEIFNNNSFSNKLFSKEELNVVKQMLTKNINSPKTSSVGRIFDAVASLIMLRHINKYEGQAAIELEHLTNYATLDDNYFDDSMIDKKNENKIFEINWFNIIKQIIIDLNKNMTKETIAIKFHNTIVEIIVAVAKLQKEKNIVLSGGCFQNMYLLENSVKRLKEEKFNPCWHQRIPTNDGGISLGQAFAVLNNIKFKG